jgi:Protein of unknown function (DUF3619)
MKKEEKILQDHEIDAIGKALRPHLDASLNTIKPGVAYRLAEARRKAVESMVNQTETQTASAFQMNGGALAMSGGFRERLTDWRFWATGLLVTGALALYGYSEYNDYVTARDAADIDVMILGDDVPVDALLDNGFSHFIREEN